MLSCHMLWIFWATHIVKPFHICQSFAISQPSYHEVYGAKARWGLPPVFSIGLMVDEHNTAMDIWWTIDGINFLRKKWKNSPKIPRVMQEISRRSTVSIQHIHRLRKKHIRSPSNLRDGSANTQRSANESRCDFLNWHMWIFLRIHFSKPPKKIDAERWWWFFFHHFGGIWLYSFARDGGC